VLTSFEAQLTCRGLSLRAARHPTTAAYRAELDRPLP